jgi:hypothetical protein
MKKDQQKIGQPYLLEASLNRRDKLPRVGTAASFQNRVRYREVILFERETGMSNWHFNREVIGFGRAHMAESVPDICLYFFHWPIWIWEMSGVFKASGTLKTMAVRRTCGVSQKCLHISLRQAINSNEGSTFNSPAQYQLN